jgi:radical SAM protein with 4Fe4S-binding SPASM domain
MIDGLKLVRRRGDGWLLFTRRGMLLSLDGHEYGIFKRHRDAVRFPESAGREEKDFISMLCSYGILKYEGFVPPDIPKRYGKSLNHADGAEPIYPSPVLAHLSVTRACNMGCRYCSVRGMHDGKGELSTEQWKTIIRKLNEWGVFQIGLTGGEPTLRGDIVELARYTESLGSTFNLTTNGWFLDEDLVVRLKEAGLQQCQVSLDSHIPRVHDELRGEGSWERVRSAIGLLKKHGIPVGIDTVVTRRNIGHIMDFIEWLGFIEVPWLTLIKLKKGDLPSEVFRGMVPDYKEYGRLIEMVCSRRNENPNVTIDCGSVSNLQFTLKDSELDAIPTAGCPIGHTLISIAPDGKMYPCSALLGERFVIGDALTDDLEKVWSESRVLRELREVKSRVHGKCSGCPRLDFCRGGCRGIADSLDDLFASDKTCGYKEVEENGGSIGGSAPGRALRVP